MDNLSLRTHDPSAAPVVVEVGSNRRPMYRYHPEQWEMATVITTGKKGEQVVESCLIPQLSVDWDVPGVNGIEGSGSGALFNVARSDAEARAGLIKRRQAEGFGYIDADQPVTAPEHLPPGVAPGPMIRQVETARPGSAPGVRYHDCWITYARVLGAGTVEKNWVTARVRWLRDMARAGLFGPIPDAFVNAERERINRKRATLAAAREKMEAAHYAERVGHIDAEFKRLDDALAAQRAAQRAA